MRTFSHWMGPRRSSAWPLIAVLLLACAIAACGSSSSESDTAAAPTSGGGNPPTTTGLNAVTVSIPVNAATLGTAGFGTNPLVITVGTTVTWVNNDSMPHTATSDTGVWDSGTLTPGQTFQFTFNTPGLFPYQCSIHGAAAQSGMIEVTAAPTPTATPTPSPTPSPTATPTPASNATYSAVSQVLNARCIQCHSSGNAIDGVALDSYGATRQEVEPGEPGSSDLYKSVSGGGMPPGGSLTQEQIQLIFDWIMAGAPNN